MTHSAQIDPELANTVRRNVRAFDDAWRNWSRSQWARSGDDFGETARLVDAASTLAKSVDAIRDDATGGFQRALDAMRELCISIMQGAFPANNLASYDRIRAMIRVIHNETEELAVDGGAYVRPSLARLLQPDSAATTTSSRRMKKYAPTPKALKHAEKYVKASGFPGVNKLAREVNVPKSVMSETIIPSSDLLTNAKREYDAQWAIRSGSRKARRKQNDDSPADAIAADDLIHRLIEERPELRAELNSLDEAGKIRLLHEHRDADE